MSLIDFSLTGRETRMRKLASGDVQEQFGDARRCAAEACSAVLSRYNPATTCSVHRGWLGEQTPRRRRRT